MHRVRRHIRVRRDRAGERRHDFRRVRTSQRELDAAVTAMGKARGALGQQLRELDSAQRALETAVREKIEDLSQQ